MRILTIWVFLLIPLLSISQIEINDLGKIDTYNYKSKRTKLITYQKPQSKWGKAGKIIDFDPSLAQELQYALDSTMSVHGLMGASVCIIFPELGFWKGVYGMSNPAKDDSIQSDMKFLIASNTKTYIATLILMLKDEGLLVYTLRIKGTSFRPKDFRKGNYTIIIDEPDLEKTQTIKNIQSIPEGDDQIHEIIFN